MTLACALLLLAGLASAGSLELAYSARRRESRWRGLLARQRAARTRRTR